MLHKLRRQIRRYLEDRLDVPTIPRLLNRLRARGFRPRGVIDVGANRGDFARSCLERWPSVRIACFEPLPHCVTELTRLSRAEPSVTVWPCLVGSQSRPEVPLFERDTASSVLPERVSSAATRMYPMTTLDAARRDLPAPDLVKLDVQGYELEVLKGAERALSEAVVIIAEVNLIDIHAGVPLMAEVIGWLSARGWVAYDVGGQARRPLDGALWQMDLAFTPADTVWRADKRWSA